MRALLISALSVPLCLFAATARADVAPDPDPWMACETLATGEACYSTEGRGVCVEKACPSDPGNTCLYCESNTTATTGSPTTGTGTTAATDASTGGSSDSSGSSSSGSSGSDGSSASTSGGKAPASGCRMETTGAGALALLALLGLRRRRRA